MARQGAPIPYGAHDGYVWKMRRTDVRAEQLLRGGQVICGRNATRLHLNAAMKHAAGFAGAHPGRSWREDHLSQEPSRPWPDQRHVRITGRYPAEGPLEFNATLTTEDGVAIAGRHRFYKGHLRRSRPTSILSVPAATGRRCGGLIETVWGYAITCHKAQGSS